MLDRHFCFQALWGIILMIGRSYCLDSHQHRDAIKSCTGPSESSIANKQVATNNDATIRVKRMPYYTKSQDVHVFPGRLVGTRRRNQPYAVR